MRLLRRIQNTSPGNWPDAASHRNKRSPVGTPPGPDPNRLSRTATGDLPDSCWAAPQSGWSDMPLARCSSPGRSAMDTKPEGWQRVRGSNPSFVSVRAIHLVNVPRKTSFRRVAYPLSHQDEFTLDPSKVPRLDVTGLAKSLLLPKDANF
jgi:hypothetical protein